MSQVNKSKDKCTKVSTAGLGEPEQARLQMVPPAASWPSAEPHIQSEVHLAFPNLPFPPRLCSWLPATLPSLPPGPWLFSEPPSWDLTQHIWEHLSEPRPRSLGFQGGSDRKESACNVEDHGSAPG